jgi:large subunit ribosomal protein L18
MVSKKNKNAERKKRHLSVRMKLSGTAEFPRLNVYRSLAHVYAQVIDDEAGTTLVAASTADKALEKALKGKTKKEAAKIVGEAVAKAALAKGIKGVKFDRGGYLYAGRIAAVAEGARAAGLDF